MIDILPLIVFAFIFFVIVAAIINGILTAARNQASVLLTREARIVGKRQDVWGGRNSSAHMSYYVTFEFADTTREEFSVNGKEYGLLAEGDRGTLRNQGSWYKGFSRNLPSPY